MINITISRTALNTLTDAEIIKLLRPLQIHTLPMKKASMPAKKVTAKKKGLTPLKLAKTAQAKKALKARKK